MAAEAIDLDMLNKLFDTQKNLDDVFSSILDDDPVQYSSQTIDENTSDAGSWESSEDFSFNEYASYKADNAYEKEKSSIAYFVIPLVLEIAAIYYGMSYLF